MTPGENPNEPPDLKVEDGNLDDDSEAGGSSSREDRRDYNDAREGARERQRERQHGQAPASPPETPTPNRPHREKDPDDQPLKPGQNKR
jgi:hypothetical protein